MNTAVIFYELLNSVFLDSNSHPIFLIFRKTWCVRTYMQALNAPLNLPSSSIFPERFRHQISPPARPGSVQDNQQNLLI